MPLTTGFSSTTSSTTIDTGLRGVEVEVGIAEAADVETREGAAERGLHHQARYAARKRADIDASGGQDIEVLTLQRRNRHRDVLNVLLRFPRRHRDLSDSDGDFYFFLRHTLGFSRLLLSNGKTAKGDQNHC